MPEHESCAFTPLGTHLLCRGVSDPAKDVAAAVPTLAQRISKMQLRELDLHLDHSDMGAAEMKALGQSLPTTLKRFCIDLRSCPKLKQDCGLRKHADVKRHITTF